MYFSYRFSCISIICSVFFKTYFLYDALCVLNYPHVFILLLGAADQGHHYRFMAHHQRAIQMHSRRFPVIKPGSPPPQFSEDMCQPMKALGPPQSSKAHHRSKSPSFSFIPIISRSPVPLLALLLDMIHFVKLLSLELVLEIVIF